VAAGTSPTGRPAATVSRSSLSTSAAATSPRSVRSTSSGRPSRASSATRLVPLAFGDSEVGCPSPYQWMRIGACDVTVFGTR